MRRLYLLRHTSIKVATGVCYGQSEVELSETYEQERDAVKTLLSAVLFHKIYTSPLKRCRILAGDINVNRTEVVIDNRLMELDFGKWEMKRWDDIYKTEYSKQWFADYVNVACPEGESYSDLLARVSGFIESLEQECNSCNFLVVTHGGVIKAFRSMVLGITPQKAFESSIGFGQVTVLDINN